MSDLPRQVDLFVAGAGTAGAALAFLAAVRGMTVVCADARLDRAGARWVNGVPRRAFIDSGVGEPSAPELRSAGAPFHMIAGWGPERVVVRDHDVLDVDMRHLVTRLQAQASDAGATLVEARVHSLRGAIVDTSCGEIRADVIVDASGEGGARLLDQAPTPRGDLCAAAQGVYEVGDRAGAHAFFEQHGAREGETLCFAGVAGGYSILNVKLHGDEVDVLSGSLPAHGHPSGRRIIDRFVDDHAWIGGTIFGGARAIPLGRPRRVMAEGRVALIGDSARQVFGAHGSGIGAGLCAARLLADTLAAGGTPEAYARAWRRRYGLLFTTYDLFQKVSRRLDPTLLARLFRAGLVSEASLRAGLEQRFPML